MKKITVLLICLVCILTACKQPGTTPATTEAPGDVSAESAYQNLLDNLKITQNDLYYSIKDIDGNTVDDLILLENTKLSIYTFDNSVNLIGTHDFLTGTARFFYSDKTNLPGIFYYTAGGGIDHYGYLTIQDGTLLLTDLWEENYAANLPGITTGTKELSTDKEKILESKALFNRNSDIQFKILK